MLGIGFGRDRSARSDAYGTANSQLPPRIAPGAACEIGWFNWIVCASLERATGRRTLNIFRTLAHNRRAFRGWLHLVAVTMLTGKLTRFDTESVIIRIAYQRGCEYELTHHRRLGRRAGIDTATMEMLTSPGPQHDNAKQWPNCRTGVLVAAVDQFVLDRQIDDHTWGRIDQEFTSEQLVELLLLMGQYDSLATIIGVLRIAHDA